MEKISRLIACSTQEMKPSTICSTTTTNTYYIVLASMKNISLMEISTMLLMSVTTIIASELPERNSLQYQFGRESGLFFKKIKTNS